MSAVERVRKSRTITISDDVWKEAEILFPGKISQLVELFLKLQIEAIKVVGAEKKH